MSIAFTKFHEFATENAKKYPDALAIFDSTKRRLTHAQFEEAIHEAADILRAHKVQATDRVLIVAENSIVTATFIFAANRMGAIAVPINARMSWAEVERIKGHATPRVLVFTTEVSPEATAHSQQIESKSYARDFGVFAVAEAHESNGDPQELGDVAVILYTTGTTGDPKGVMLTQNNILYAAEVSRDIRKLTYEDRIYGVLPLTHVFGLASMLMAGNLAGATLHLETRFSAEKLYEALLDKITILPAVPQMHAHLMKYAHDQNLTTLNSPTLRYVSSGAAPLDPAWKRKAEAFYEIALQNGYGMTECTAGVTSTLNSIGTPDISVGKALPRTEVSLAKPEDVGEVLVRGPHVMKGYYKNPEATAASFTEDGWLKTGDLGKFDAHGNLHIVGRSKELIIRGGFNVYPPEVEAALNDHPSVIQAAVIGRSTGDGNEEVLAFVQCDDPDQFDIEAVREFVCERLSGYKRPRQIIPAKVLPAAATGKILKHKLLDFFADRLE